MKWKHAFKKSFRTYFGETTIVIIVIIASRSVELNEAHGTQSLNLFDSALCSQTP